MIILLIKSGKNPSASKCPVCGNEMDEMQSGGIIQGITLGAIRRIHFLCYGCFWEGRRILKAGKRKRSR